jgi:hypothetical protein
MREKCATAAQQPARWHDSGMPSKGLADSVNGVVNAWLLSIVKDSILPLNEG